MDEGVRIELEPVEDPQHFNDESSRIAHVYEKPPETATAVRPAPRSTN